MSTAHRLSLRFFTPTALYRAITDPALRFFESAHIQQGVLKRRPRSSFIFIGLLAFLDYTLLS